MTQINMIDVTEFSSLEQVEAALAQKRAKFAEHLVYYKFLADEYASVIEKGDYDAFTKAMNVIADNHVGLHNTGADLARLVAIREVFAAIGGIFGNVAPARLDPDLEEPSGPIGHC